MKMKKFDRPIIVGKRTRSPFSDIVKIKNDSNGFGVLKAFIVFGIIGFQLLLFIILHTTFILSFKWTALLTFIVSLITCIFALSSNKNSHSKAVWIIFLLLFFPFSYIFYLLSDERVLLSRSNKRYKSIYLQTEKYTNRKTGKSKNKNVNNNCAYLYNAGGFNAYNNTKAEYFSSGARFFDDVIDRIQCAKEFVFLEFFIIADGVLFCRVFDILKQKVLQGVDVRVVYDDMGSHKVLSRKNKLALKNAGIKIQPFNKIAPFFSLALNYRDHRKIIIVDGKTAYTGGCNLADEYVNEKRMHGYWKDSGIRLDGKAVDALTLSFLRQWEFLTKIKEDYAVFLNKADDFENDSVFVPYADGLDYGKNIGKNVYENMIACANQKIYVMTPYFIVDNTLSDLLINKAMSGVDVRLVIPEIPDKSFVYGVSRNNAEKLIDSGVKVFCMKKSFVHSKVLLTENSAVVGSINMDLRSFYQQFECAVFTDDIKILKAVELDFDSTIKESVLITEKNKLRNHLIYRAFAGVMQIFAPFM